ncbi:lysoplasmalogenase TMEM86A-like isoform X2 [Drosophila virilis]|uniref:lysoplasmalogenase TMEM86A-like isoform X2 n=1 Tax=Drosophila virilis TaxID=7244 RepID=UPI0038B3EB85
MYYNLRFLAIEFLKLIPFYISVVLYFSLVRQDQVWTLWTSALRCLPIMALMFYVSIKGLSIKKHYGQSQLILIGLMFSCAGDVMFNLLLFALGMTCFGATQICYMFAFGWRPLKIIIGACLHISSIGLIYFVIGHLNIAHLIGVFIYCTLITGMFWRSLARALHVKSFLAFFAAVGAALFIISDALAAVIHILHVKLPAPRLQIMITYYAAQFAIALSTADEGRPPAGSEQ